MSRPPEHPVPFSLVCEGDGPLGIASPGLPSFWLPAGSASASSEVDRRAGGERGWGIYPPTLTGPCLAMALFFHPGLQLLLGGLLQLQKLAPHRVLSARGW